MTGHEARRVTAQRGNATNPEGIGTMDFRITLTGTRPLIMNNARMANPLDPATKAYKVVSGKRNKTEQDLEELFRLGHAGALYIDPDYGPYLPMDNIWKSLEEGAMNHKLGPKIREGVLIKNDVNPLEYRGPRDMAGLYANEHFKIISMRVTGSGRGRKRVPFCRPIFREWKVEAEGTLDESILDLNELQLSADAAGQRVGICDWHPKYGRFTATVERA